MNKDKKDEIEKILVTMELEEKLVKSGEVVEAIASCQLLEAQLQDT